MNKTKRRCVLDTNQIVGAGSRWLSFGIPERPNPHLALLLLVLRRHRGLCSSQILDEYAEKLIERGSPVARTRALILYLQLAFDTVTIVSRQAPIRPRDPDDEVFLLCALDGDADYLISEDSDLLDLTGDYVRPSIVSCAEALAAL